MKFVLIFGPQAVGKMTVGYELAQRTGLKLFHNHMTIDLLHPYFGFGNETWRLSGLFRNEIFEAVSKSNLEGLIFTYVWAFNLKSDWDYVENVCGKFEANGGELFFVELEADLNERLVRNRSEFRLQNKPTKRDIEQSEANLLDTLDRHRLNSYEGEITKPNYIRINNTDLSAEEVAAMIKDRFHL